MPALHSPCADSAGTGAPDTEIEITPAMIRVGAAALMDSSELTRQFGPTDAEYYAERILRAALSSRAAA